MAFIKTYLSEFCAHEDEENQSQELARRLHLLPPVCVDQRSHMQIESLCVPPHSSPLLPARNSLDSFVVFFKVLFLLLLFPVYYLIPQQPSSRTMCFTESSLCIFSSYRSLTSVPLPFALRGCTYLSPRRTVLSIGLKTR